MQSIRFGARHIYYVKGGTPEKREQKVRELVRDFRTVAGGRFLRRNEMHVNNVKTRQEGTVLQFLTATLDRFETYPARAVREAEAQGHLIDLNV